MFDLIEKQSVMPKENHWGPAEIIEVPNSEGLARVRIPGQDEDQEVWARWAIPYGYECETGEMALVAGRAIDDLYIIGLLSSPKVGDREPKKLSLKNGASVAVVRSSAAEKLELRSKAGQLMIEYDAETGKTRINAGSGDLEFVSHAGNIDFAAAQGIRFSCKQRMEMRSDLGIQLAVSVIGKLLSSLVLHPGKLKMTSNEMVVESQKSEMRIAEARYVGRRLSSTIASVRLVAGKLETVASQVVQKVKNIYTQVEGLTQLTTKRMRTLVGSTYHFKSQKAFLKADEDFKVNADKIHLG